jgi:hypothetical protein
MRLDMRRSTESEELLDEAIRHALKANTPFREPPRRVWKRISRQVAAGPAAHGRPPMPSLSQLLAPLVQGLAATAILLLLGFSLGPSLWVQSYQFGSRQAVTPVAKVAALPDAAKPANGGHAIAWEKRLTAVEDRLSDFEVPKTVVMESPAPVELTFDFEDSREDMLSKGVLLRHRRPAAESSRTFYVQAVDPNRDPVLVNLRSSGD